MIRFLREISVLTRLEWARRGLFVFSCIAGSLVAWAGALYIFPSLGDGSYSLNLLFLASGLFGSLLASDSVARDTGAGRIDFLYTIGATPGGVFASRILVFLTATGLYACVLYGAEWSRLYLFPPGPVSRKFTEQSLQSIAETPREAFLLFCVPAFSLFIFLSAVSSRTRTAIAAGCVAAALIVISDQWQRTHAESRERAAATETIATFLCIPGSLALATIAHFVRRYEPERSVPRVALAGAAIAMFLIRFGMIYQSGTAVDLQQMQVTALSVSPGADHIAIEARSVWRPPEWLAEAGSALGRPLPSGDSAYSPRVILTKPGGGAILVSNMTLELDRNPASPGWISSRHVRVRGVHPDFYDESGDCADHPLILDATCKKLTLAPTISLHGAPGPERSWCIEMEPEFGARERAGPRTLKDNDEDDEIELCHLSAVGSLRTNRSGEVVLVARGERKRLWPVPVAPAAPPGASN